MESNVKKSNFKFSNYLRHIYESIIGYFRNQVLIVFLNHLSFELIQKKRIPIKKYGFIPVPADVVIKDSFIIYINETCKDPLVLKKMDVIKKLCSKCKRDFNPHINKKGDCSHTSSWHSAFGDCNLGTINNFFCWK